jgi:hypothetical protein
LAGDNQKALLLYNNIIKLYPNTHYAKDSRERIAKLAESGTSPPAPAPAPEPAATPPPLASAPVTPIAPAPTTPPPPAPAAPPPATAPAIVTTSPPPSSGPNTPIYERGWFWGAVAVVVAAGAIITAVALSSGGSTSPWNNTDPVSAGVVR